MKRLVLVGAGHAHARVLADWARAPVPGVELCVVSPGSLAPYSGMVPGWLAGHYTFDAICIDFAALAARSGARLVIDEVVSLDADRRALSLKSGASLGYDLLSLNVGSTLTPPHVPGTRVLALRPLGELRNAWDDTLAELAALPPGRLVRVTAVGGGAAGVESLLALHHRLRAMQSGRAVQSVLVSRSEALLPGAASGAVQAMRRALANAGVRLQLGTDFDPSHADAPDLVLWATGAEAHGWQRASGLAVNGAGFIRVDAQLRSLSHANVYAAGDCAAWSPPLPKAGVFAVKMSPVLSHNLRAALGGGTAQAYEPQRRYLSLLATGGRHAVASWGGWSAEGAWVWRWKDRIDRRFLRRFGASPIAADRSISTTTHEDLA